jgi:hypothetical protein
MVAATKEGDASLDTFLAELQLVTSTDVPGSKAPAALLKSFPVAPGNVAGGACRRILLRDVLKGLPVGELHLTDSLAVGKRLQ